MGKTHCLGCNKSLGGVIDAFGFNMMSGQVCLTCKKKLQVIPNFQYLAAQPIKDFIAGKIDAQSASSTIGSTPTIGPSYADVGSTYSSQSSYQLAQSQPAPVMDVSEELRKYKALCDDGIITEEEFSAVKKRLLGL